MILCDKNFKNCWFWKVFLNVFLPKLYLLLTMNFKILVYNLISSDEIRRITRWFNHWKFRDGTKLVQKSKCYDSWFELIIVGHREMWQILYKSHTWEYKDGQKIRNVLENNIEMLFYNYAKNLLIWSVQRNMRNKHTRE